MTRALCLNCGAIKFGALCSCPKCSAESTGYNLLDIAFSDHNLAISTLEQLGAVIGEIHVHSDDATKCFWTFIQYVSRDHPDILSVELQPEATKQIQEVLDKCVLPKVTLADSPLKEIRVQGGDRRNDRNAEQKPGRSLIKGSPIGPAFGIARPRLLPPNWLNLILLRNTLLPSKYVKRMSVLSFRVGATS